MLKLLLSWIILFTVSPIWPLGPNPLPGDPFLIVNKKTNEVAFIYKERIQVIMHAATGKQEDLTPEGLHTVIVKAEQPYYRRKNIAGGAPNNPLGSRWIGFDANGTDGRIYGIHGTNRPEKIGMYVTEGCVRIHNDEIERLYDLIPIGTKVLIISTDKSYEQLAKQFGALKNEKAFKLIKSMDISNN